MAAITAENSSRIRHHGLDQLRGLAVALMVVDHATAVLDGPTIGRLVGRLALPLFCLTAGALATRPARPRRLLSVTGAAIAAAVLISSLGLPGPYFLVGLVTARELVATFPGAWWLPIAAATLAAQPFAVGPIAPAVGYWPPGLLLLVWIGRSYGPWFLAAKLPSSRLLSPLAVVGRYPLTVYVGHLAALVALAAL